MKKSTKQKSRKRKNPINEKFLWIKFGIPLPVGLPEDSNKAFKVGVLFGYRKLLIQCKSGRFLATLNMVRIAEKSYDRNALPFTSEGLPSDAFMLGIYKGILDGGKFCLDTSKTRTYLGLYGFGSSEAIDSEIERIESNPLFKKYYPPEETIKKRTALEKIGIGKY